MRRKAMASGTEAEVFFIWRGAFHATAPGFKNTVLWDG